VTGTILDTEGLTKAYGRRPPALRDVTLSIGEGVTGLLGPNGAGKSTLLQCVLGLLPDWSGSVRVLGLDAHRDRKGIRRRVGFMPETDAYVGGMTGIRAVRYLGQLSGLPYRDALRRAHEVLFHVGLGEAIYRSVEEYSTGMRQRFKLAQAIVHDPELVFLDEPLSGLDPEGRDELLHLIHDLARSHGKHVVWSSHILPEVQKVADAVVVLDRGECRGSFRLADLGVRPGRYALEVEGAVEGFREVAARAGVTLEDGAGDGPQGGPVSARHAFTAEVAAGGGTAPIFDAVRAAGLRLRRLTPRGDTLEEVFHRLVRPSAEAAR
jgi:ABC-2 type transport system ATP-binding protein